MSENRVTRRQFVRETAVGAAALAAGISAGSIVEVGNAAGTNTSGILNYNPDMEYRRCGKTEWMISSACLGGHWKRVNEMVPGLFNGGSWLSANLGDPAFQQNRYDVVTRCIERGINYIDACTGAEIIAYSKALEGRRDQMHLGWSWYEREARSSAACNGDALIKVFEDSLVEAKQEYVDLYRIVCGVDGRKGENGEEPVTHITPETPYSESSGWPDPHYSHPYPITEEIFLASRANHRVHPQGQTPPVADRGIYLVYPDGGRVLIYEDPDVASFSPIAVRKRRRPPALAPVTPSNAPATGALDFRQSTAYDHPGKFAHPGNADVLDQWPAFNTSCNAVQWVSERVGQLLYHRRPDSFEGVLLQHPWHYLHGFTEANNFANDFGLVIQGVVKDFLGPYFLYIGYHTTQKNGQYVHRPTWINTGNKNRAARLLTEGLNWFNDLFQAYRRV